MDAKCLRERDAGPVASLLSLLSVLTACSSAGYTADADREVDAILKAAQQQVLGDRDQWIVRPELPAEAPAEAPAERPPEPPPALPAPPDRQDEAAPRLAETFDLRRALLTAVAGNREYLARKEALYRQGLAMAAARFRYGPQLAATVSYVWPDAEGATAAHEAGASLSASQLLPTGGTLGVAAGLDAAWPYGPSAGERGFGTSAAVTLTQPLLRGAGREVSYEGLTQAERELVYAIRDFELFREGFSIDVAGRFFELVSQKQTLANEDANYAGAVFDRGKAEALHQVGRNAEQEVFRARRREIEAKDQLIAARAAYDRAVDEFKILLGLPTSATIALADEEPPYEPVRIEAAAAVAAARHNRLDLITERQRVEDAERALRIAENGLLPDLDLVASYGLAGEGEDLDRAGPDRWNSSVGLTFAVPLQRTNERNAWRSSLIALAQAQRALQLREDQLDLDIRDALRRLRSIEERIALQQEQIGREQAAVTVTEIRYESGKLENRDLLEARQALVNARNALIRLKVEHFTGRLSLQRDLGVFTVGEGGMWR